MIESIFKTQRVLPVLEDVYLDIISRPLFTNNCRMKFPKENIGNSSLTLKKNVLLKYLKDSYISYTKKNV